MSVAGIQRKPLHLATFTCSVSQIVFYMICVWLFSHCWFFLSFKERQSLKAHLHYCKPQFKQSCVALHCQYELGHKKKYGLTKRTFICLQEKNPNFFELVIADYREAHWFHVKCIELWNSLSVPTCCCSCRQRSVVTLHVKEAFIFGGGGAGRNVSPGFQSMQFFCQVFLY